MTRLPRTVPVGVPLSCSFLARSLEIARSQSGSLSTRAAPASGADSAVVDRMTYAVERPRAGQGIGMGTPPTSPRYARSLARWGESASPSSVLVQRFDRTSQWRERHGHRRGPIADARRDRTPPESPSASRPGTPPVNRSSRSTIPPPSVTIRIWLSFLCRSMAAQSTAGPTNVDETA